MKTKAVLDHFSNVDPVLHKIIVTENIELTPFIPFTDHSQFFPKLCREIISQQLVGKAADAIFNRFLALFPDKKITPKKILELSEQALRNVGMSWAKVRYVQNLAQETQSEAIKYDQFHTLPDEEIISELIQVKGIGRWTAEMFLIFTLGREDVFSFGDLGLKNSFKKVYNVKDDKTLQKKMITITSRWSPYRSYGAMALWRFGDKTM